MEGHVDISELTWEQREQVLRLLFSKMNATRHPLPDTTLPQLPAPEEAADTYKQQQLQRYIRAFNPWCFDSTSNQYLEVGRVRLELLNQE